MGIPAALIPRTEDAIQESTALFFWMEPHRHGYFFLPTYATLLTAISFDQAGATRSGKYILKSQLHASGYLIECADRIHIEALRLL